MAIQNALRRRRTLYDRSSAPGEYLPACSPLLLSKLRYFSAGGLQQSASSTTRIFLVSRQLAEMIVAATGDLRRIVSHPHNHVCVLVMRQGQSCPREDPWQFLPSGLLAFRVFALMPENDRLDGKERSSRSVGEALHREGTCDDGESASAKECTLLKVAVESLRIGLREKEDAVTELVSSNGSLSSHDAIVKQWTDTTIQEKVL